jgi:apolipoprotein N-acyltransferase
MVRLPRLRILFGLASGMLLALAFPPYSVPGIAWFALAALIFAMLDARWWVAPLAGFLHGAGFYFASVPWVYDVMREHGRLSAFAAAGVLALMVAVLSIFPAVFALAIARLSKRSIPQALVLAPFLWAALELGRTHMPVIGFPWNLLGYAVVEDLGLMQIASVTGIYGVSFVVAAYNTLLAWLLVSRSRRAWMAWLASTGVLLPLAVVGHQFVPEERPQKVAHLVQTNFPQSLAYSPDWMAQHAAALDELEALSIAAAQRLPGPVIWPEVPAPFSLQEPHFAARAERIAQQAQNYALFGVVDWKPQPGAPPERVLPHNSAVLLDPAGSRAFTYDKIRLVPFGEYVPLRRLLGFARSLTAEVGDFSAGSEYAVGELPGGRFAVLICYEAIFPAQVRRYVAGGAEVLVNMSNDGWFSRAGAPEQHLQLARARAIENRRWLLRATNNGQTVVVDPHGRIRARLTADIRGVLEAQFDFRSGRTLYSRLGDWWAWLCVLAAIAIYGRGIRGRRPEAKSEIRN